MYSDPVDVGLDVTRQNSLTDQLIGAISLCSAWRTSRHRVTCGEYGRGSGTWPQSASARFAWRASSANAGGTAIGASQTIPLRRFACTRCKDSANDWPAIVAQMRSMQARRSASTAPRNTSVICKLRSSINRPPSTFIDARMAARRARTSSVGQSARNIRSILVGLSIPCRKRSPQVCGRNINIGMVPRIGSTLVNRQRRPALLSAKQ
jgi:hypothetical protein